MPALTGTTNDRAWADDHALLQRSLRGDREATDEFVERMVCIPRFLRRFDKRAGDPLGEHGLADLSQEVAARVWRHRQRFSGSSRLESWIFGYARIVFQEALGAERNLGERLLALDEDPDQQVDPSARVDDAVADQLDAQTILDLVDGLPGRECEVIRARLLDGVSFPAIAQRRGEDINAVKTRYYRALASIRVSLKADPAQREERE